MLDAWMFDSACRFVWVRVQLDVNLSGIREFHARMRDFRAPRKILTHDHVIVRDSEWIFLVATGGCAFFNGEHRKKFFFYLTPLLNFDNTHGLPRQRRNQSCARRANPCSVTDVARRFDS